MGRVALVVGLVAGAVALAAGIAAAVIRPTAAGPLYTPAQFAALHLRARLRVGQTLYLKGILRDSGSPGWGGWGGWSGWSGWDGSGVIAESPSSLWGGVRVFVIYGPRSGLSRLRGAPLVGPLLPPTADHPLTGKVAVFRLRAVRCGVSPICTFRTPALQLQDGGTP